MQGGVDGLGGFEVSVTLSMLTNYIGLKLSVKREITMEVYLQS